MVRACRLQPDQNTLKFFPIEAARLSRVPFEENAIEWSRLGNVKQLVWEFLGSSMHCCGTAMEHCESILSSIASVKFESLFAPFFALQWQHQKWRRHQIHGRLAGGPQQLLVNVDSTQMDVSSKKGRLTVGTDPSKAKQQDESKKQNRKEASVPTSAKATGHNQRPLSLADPSLLLDMQQSIGIPEPFCFTPRRARSIDVAGGSIHHYANEVVLLHGATEENAQQIVKQGFDERLTQPKLYGRGVYFTADACKAVQYSGQNAMKPTSIRLSMGMTVMKKAIQIKLGIHQAVHGEVQRKVMTRTMIF